MFDTESGENGNSPRLLIADRHPDVEHSGASGRRRIKTDNRDVPVETLHTWVTRGKLRLQPEFQRNYVWTPLKASRLVESLLLEIPLPVVYVAEEENGTYSVVDGQQRLASISGFLSGVFPGTGGDFKLCNLRVAPGTE